MYIYIHISPQQKPTSRWKVQISLQFFPQKKVAQERKKFTKQRVMSHVLYDYLVVTTLSIYFFSQNSLLRDWPLSPDIWLFYLSFISTWPPSPFYNRNTYKCIQTYMYEPSERLKSHMSLQKSESYHIWCCLLYVHSCEWGAVRGDPKKAIHLCKRVSRTTFGVAVICTGRLVLLFCRISSLL